MEKPNTIVEDGVVAGNYFDKYGTSNVIARKMMANFENSVTELVAASGATSIHEIGCGEGHLALKLINMPQVRQLKGTDFSQEVIKLAKTTNANDGISYEAKSVYDLDRTNDSAELIVCCEVLEHLEEPVKALEIMQSLNASHYIFSVPREPLWCALNLARGKYIGQFGNTPGHIQHWSKRGFKKMISNHFFIESTKSPLPWTMVLCKPK